MPGVSRPSKSVNKAKSGNGRQRSLKARQLEEIRHDLRAQTGIILGDEPIRRILNGLPRVT